MEKIEEKQSQKQPSKYPNCWPMVRVTWLDAMDGESGWVELDKMLNAKLATCVDIGWMIRNDEKTVTIMGSWCLEPQEDKDEDKEGGRYITIPKGWVKSITNLQEEEKKAWT